MATNAYIGGWTFKIGDGGDPETFTAIEENSDISGLGQTNALVKVTHFGSGGNEEYIGGLADGSEITLQCNHVVNATVAGTVITNVENKANGNVQVDITDGTNTMTLDFNVAYLGYEYAPSVDDKNMISFTMKISGGITRS